VLLREDLLYFHFEQVERFVQPLNLLHVQSKIETLLVASDRPLHTLSIRPSQSDWYLDQSLDSPQSWEAIEDLTARPYTREFLLYWFLAWFDS
jgi:hypothetical protein